MISPTLMKKFVKYGGAQAGMDGWVVTPYAMIRGEWTGKVDAPKRGFITQQRKMRTRCASFTRKVTISAFGIRTPHSEVYPLTGMPKRKDDRLLGLTAIFKQVIEKIEPDKLVRGHTGIFSNYAVVAIKNKRVVGIFMPMFYVALDSKVVSK